MRRLFGQSTMAEIVQNMLSEVARNTLTERGERAAMPPDYKLPEDEKEADKILSGKADLAYTMTYEVLPKVELGDFKAISIERPVVDVSDAEVEEQLEQLADSARASRPKAARPRPATG